MLDFRWNHGWRLDRIIDHGKTEIGGKKLIIYYFSRFVNFRKVPGSARGPPGTAEDDEDDAEDEDVKDN